MAFMRNIGAAVSFGAVETTKAKEAREQYERSCAAYEERRRQYDLFARRG